MFRINTTFRYYIRHYQQTNLLIRDFSKVGRKCCPSRINICDKTGLLFNPQFTIQSKINGQANIIYRRQFHITEVRQALPPLLLLVLRPLTNIAAILVGKTIKKWWRSLTPEKKKAFLQNLRKNKLALLVLSSFSSIGMLSYYVSHLEVDPLTGRSKFIAFSNEQLLQIAQMELDMQIQLNKDHFLPASHPAFVRVTRVANQLLKSNRDLLQIQQRNWSITVVDDPLITNAFVLPSGHIFVFTGILNACSNDDQLCVIIAHEVSHVLLSHVAEQMSNMHLVGLLVLFPLAVIWAVLPDGAALLTQWLSGVFAKILLHLPFSRALEAEADEIGLRLTAKACYDVREASVFWARMRTEDEIEWLSTHPSSETRQNVIDELMPSAIQIRDSCKCPRLPNIDPRVLIKVSVPSTIT